MRNKTDAIISDIKWNINSGVYKAPDKLPSENALSIKYDCSRLTARKALQLLKTEGLIISRHGKGYFVSMGQHKKIYEPLKGKKGKKEAFHVVELPLTSGQCEIFRVLDKTIRKNKKDFNFSFMKTQYDLSNAPYTVLHSYLNTHLTGNFKVETLKESLSAFFAKKQLKIKRRVQRTVIGIPPQEIKLKLNLQKNEKVVMTYSLMYEKDDNLLEMAIRYTILSQYSETIERLY